MKPSLGCAQYGSLEVMRIARQRCQELLVQQKHGSRMGRNAQFDMTSLAEDNDAEEEEEKEESTYRSAGIVRSYTRASMHEMKRPTLDGNQATKMESVYGQRATPRSMKSVRIHATSTALASDAERDAFVAETLRSMSTAEIEWTTKERRERVADCVKMQGMIASHLADAMFQQVRNGRAVRLAMTLGPVCMNGCCGGRYDTRG